MTIHRPPCAVWAALDEEERRWLIDRAHHAAIVDNFTWHLKREVFRVGMPLAEWLAKIGVK